MKKKILLLIISVAIVTAVFTAGEYAARRFTPWRPTFQEDAQFLERFRDAWKPFFRIEKRDGRRWLVQNPRLNVFLPPQEFPLEKTPGVPRVLVLGESSAVGLGRALIDLLPTTGPAPRMEIMNCAVGGASLEITDRKFRELIRYDPDLIVLLFGHNLYVPYATISPWIYRARHFARRSALLGKLADRVFDNPREYIDVEGRVKEFEAFLARLGSETGRRGIRLVLCTAPANLMFPPRADEATRHAPNYLEALYQRIVGNDKDAEDRLAGLLSDRPAALWHFRLGEWLSARSPREAARHLVGARDLDPDRNRASTAVNGAIRSAAQGRAWLFDAEAWVAAQAPESLPGWESFQDQVHVWDDLYMKQAREIVGIWKRNNWPEEGFDFAMDGRELPKERPLWSLLSELERRGGERTAPFWWDAAAGRFAHAIRTNDDEARRVLQEEIFKQENPAGYRARLTLAVARAHWMTGKRGAAMTLLNQTRGLAPRWEDVDVWEGLWRLETGDAAAAELSFSEAHRKNPRHPVPVFFLDKLKSVPTERGASTAPPSGKFSI